LRALPRPQPLAPIRLDEPAPAFRPEKHLLEHRLAQQPEQRHVVMREPDERAPQRRADHERPRAVDRIQVPAIRPASAALRLFLADDAVSRIALGDHRAQPALSRLVRVRDRIENPLALVLDRERLAKVRLRDTAGGMSELDREILELEYRNVG